MKNVILIIFVCFITGCAANIQHSFKTSNIQQGTMPDSITLDIVTASTITKNANLVKSIDELNKLIATEYKGHLIPRGASERADVSVEITVEHFRYVSGFGRFMAGVMVGDAELKLSVKLIDLATNKVVNESQLDTESQFSEGIFGATTSRQLEAMSKKIVSMIETSAKNNQ
jgi:hypothetical protein